MCVSVCVYRQAQSKLVCVYEVLFSLSLNAMGVIEDDWEVFKPSLSDLLASFAKLLCVCAFEKERERMCSSPPQCVFMCIGGGMGGGGQKIEGERMGLLAMPVFVCLNTQFILMAIYSSVGVYSHNHSALCAAF